NIDIVRQVSQQLKDIDDNLIKSFVNTFAKSCMNNSEYTEFSNEVLFSLADKQPKSLIRILDQNKKQIDLNLILNAFSNPINDGVNVKHIRQQIESVNTKSSIRNKIIDALNIAIGNH
ncbi:MAG: hypothetical protein KDD94_04535, partial [Calditrichaeota bacterium]|nr:hypothetical protein [Calditrichota bacterium]